MSAIAVQLGRLRLDRHLTQQQLADRIDVRRDTISALERGKSQGIEFETLARLCDALGCTPNDLLALSTSAHVTPILGGEDEDAIIEERLAGLDLAALVAEPPPLDDEGENEGSHTEPHEEQWASQVRVLVGPRGSGKTGLLARFVADSAFAKATTHLVKAAEQDGIALYRFTDDIAAEPGETIALAVVDIAGEVVTAESDPNRR